MHSLWELGLGTLEPSVLEGYDLARVGRVVAEYGDQLEVLGPEGDRVMVSVAGSLRHRRPAVGDFVALDDSFARIDEVLRRRTALVRQAAGTTTREQVIAANIDIVFIVTSMNEEFNESRLERYLAVAWDSGATPVILVNKSDLTQDPDAFVERTRGCALGVDVVAMSAVNERGLEPLDVYLQRGRSYVLVGSSGVGKSTIVNALIGEQLQKTAEIRQDDGEGRHTTSRRDLIVLTGDRGVLIDTPGMRELQIWGSEEGLDTTFEDIEALAAQCRFRDCSHEGEPSCAVRLALESGELDERRFHNYQKLHRELVYHASKRDVAATRAEHRKFAQMVKTVTKEKKGQKGW